jgi:hypothetical protein
VGFANGVVVGGTRNDLARFGLQDDIDSDRGRAGPVGVDDFAGGAPQQRADGYRAARADRLPIAHTVEWHSRYLLVLPVNDATRGQ